MKLKVYNRQVSGVAKGLATLRVHKQGSFSLSKAAMEMMELRPGHKVEVVQDLDRPRDWYITKSTGDDAFVVRGKASQGGMFASSITAASIKKACELDTFGATSYQFLIGKEPVAHDGAELWPIITKSATPRS